MADTKASAFSGIGTWTALAEGDLFPFINVDGTGAAKNSVATLTQMRTGLNCAPLNSPAFTGIPTAPTHGAADASTKIATTAHVESKVIKTNALGSYSVSQKSIHAANSGLQVMIPVRLADASGSLAVGNYELITVPANFRLESFRLVFDGPTFVSPDTTIGFTIQSLLGGETSELHSHSGTLDAQVIAPVLAGFNISAGTLLRLDFDTFDGIGYGGIGIVNGGVVWLGGFWL